MPSSSGHELDNHARRVRNWIADPARLDQIGEAIRLAFDWVIDGPRTGRYSINQLETSEKIYIGNRVEHEILHKLELQKTTPLDTSIEGVQVDIKFSLTQRRDWMIPPEAVNQVCIMITASDENSHFSVGIFRAKLERLGKPNRDKKHPITKLGRSAIDWICADRSLPRNFLLHLEPHIRVALLNLPSGRQRVIEMFRQLTGRPISTNAIDSLAIQRDPSKRVREAREILKKEGIWVFSSRYDNIKLTRLGVEPLKDDYWMSLKLSSEQISELEL